MQTERKHERKKIIRPVYFLSGDDTSDFAFSLDLSSCGLCIITNRNDLSPGDSLRLYSRFFWDDPKKAIAIWTDEVNNTVFTVGLALCDGTLIH